MDLFNPDRIYSEDKFISKGKIFTWIKQYYDSTGYLSICYEDIEEKEKEKLKTYESLKDYTINVNKYKIDLDGKPLTSIHYLKESELKNELLRTIGADCWCVYTLTPLRELKKTYFNTLHDERNPSEIPDDDENVVVRGELIDNCQPLIDDMKAGNMVYIIMSHFFVDYIYTNVPGTDIYSITEIRYTKDFEDKESKDKNLDLDLDKDDNEDEDKDMMNEKEI